MNVLAELVWLYGVLGLLAFGGVGSVLAEMYRQLVEVQGWISPQEFRDGYALAQLSPGPNAHSALVFGFMVAGLPGALSAGLAFYGAPALLSALLSGVWGRVGHHPWARATRLALLPLGLGLMMSGTLTLAKVVATDAFAVVVALATAWVAYRGRTNPALLVLLGGLLGLLWSSLGQ